jgi:hypothetical protein
MSAMINFLISFVLNISIIIVCTVYANESVQNSTDDAKKNNIDAYLQ